MTMLADTQPMPAFGGMPARTYRVGDRLTDVFEIAPGVQRRYVGTVVESSVTVFRVQWDNGRGIATYAHGCEPGSLRLATRADEHAAAVAEQRHLIAGELRRLAERQTTWPGEVRRTLRNRAAELTGGAA